MAEYIKRRDALKVLEQMETIEDGLDAMHNLPAADVVEVVRCAECKHWGGVTFGNVCRRWSFPHLGSKNCTKPNDFCSYGERGGGE